MNIKIDYINENEKQISICNTDNKIIQFFKIKKINNKLYKVFSNDEEIKNASFFDFNGAIDWLINNQIFTIKEFYKK